MNQSFITNQYAQYAGFNSWAENNNIIILYPYVKVSSVEPYNPKGCWDWWGYTNVINYGTRSGIQVMFVNNLIKALMNKSDDVIESSVN